MNNKDNNFPPQEGSQDPFSQDSFSEKFDEMDELALSLQRQIKDFDNIPELDKHLDDSIADDQYESSFSQEKIHNDEKLQNQAKSGSLKQLLKQRLLKQNFEEGKQTPVYFKLHFLVPTLIGLFFVISSATYWLLKDGPDEELSNTQNMTLSLPEKPTSLLNEEAKLSELEDGSEAEIKKIPLVYLDEQTEKQVEAPQQEELTKSINTEQQPIQIDEVVSSNEKEVLQEQKNKSIKKTQLVPSKTDKVVLQNKSTTKKSITKKPLIKATPAFNIAPIISKVTPSPVIGNNKRQWIDIKGNHFDTKTIVILQWTEKAKSSVKLRSKLFSISKNNSQLKFINKNHIRLHVNTGEVERTWQLNLKNNKSSSADYQFTVVKPFAMVTKAPQSKTKKKPVSSKDSGKYHSYLKNQPDNYFTLQLLGSSNYSAIQKVVQNHNNYADLFWYKNKREGKDWYTLFYGSYKTKETALQSYNKLPKSLASVKPWIRNIKDVKKQLINNYDRQDVSDVNKMLDTSNNRVANLTKSGKKQLAVTNMRSSILAVNGEQWTFQLISLSSEKAIKDYIKKNKLNAKARYFRRNVNGESLYTLLYSTYDSKELALVAQKKLPVAVRQTKPWIRKYADIHKQMR